MRLQAVGPPCKRPWPAGAARPDCRGGRRTCSGAATVVIHVLAEQATLDGTSDHPGYLPGFGILPAESVRDLAAVGRTVKPLTVPTRINGAGISAVARR